MTLSSSGAAVEVIRWDDEHSILWLLDQTRLPGEITMLKCETVQHVWDAIVRLSVRGAPGIGIAAAYAVCLAASDVRPAAVQSDDALRSRVQSAIDHLATSRPTAVNLFWALARMNDVANQASDPSELRSQLVGEAIAIHQQDRQLCDAIARHGAERLEGMTRFLTHCNAGKLATGGVGTALAPIYLMHDQGIAVEVFADETRPLLQGSRLTAWELSRAGIPVTILADSMAGSVLRAGKVDAVIVGADRITANGDVANKIGTYPLAVLANFHGVPFFVAAPQSTFDLSLASGDEIPIEERSASEITHTAGWHGSSQVPGAFNPAFDVTPASLIAAIVTDIGVIERPTVESIRGRLGSKLFQKQ